MKRLFCCLFLCGLSVGVQAQSTSAGQKKERIQCYIGTTITTRCPDVLSHQDVIRAAQPDSTALVGYPVQIEGVKEADGLSILRKAYVKDATLPITFTCPRTALPSGSTLTGTIRKVTTREKAMEIELERCDG